MRNEELWFKSLRDLFDQGGNRGGRRNGAPATVRQPSFSLFHSRPRHCEAAGRGNL